MIFGRNLRKLLNFKNKLSEYTPTVAHSQQSRRNVILNLRLRGFTKLLPSRSATSKRIGVIQRISSRKSFSISRVVYSLVLLSSRPRTRCKGCRISFSCVSLLLVPEVTCSFHCRRFSFQRLSVFHCHSNCNQSTLAFAPSMNSANVQAGCTAGPHSLHHRSWSRFPGTSLARRSCSSVGTGRSITLSIERATHTLCVGLCSLCITPPSHRRSHL